MNLSDLIQWRVIPCSHKIQSRSIGDLPVLHSGTHNLAILWCHHINKWPSRLLRQRSERWGIMLAFNNLHPKVIYYTFVQSRELAPWLHPNPKRDKNKEYLMCTNSMTVIFLTYNISIHLISGRVFYSYSYSLPLNSSYPCFGSSETFSLGVLVR